MTSSLVNSRRSLLRIIIITYFVSIVNKVVFNRPSVLWGEIKILAARVLDFRATHRRVKNCIPLMAGIDVLSVLAKIIQALILFVHLHIEFNKILIKFGIILKFKYLDNCF